MDIIHKWKAGLQWKTWKLSMEKCFNTPHGQFSMDSVDKRGHLVRGYCPWKSMDQIHSPWTHSMEFMEILHGQYVGRLFSGLLWKNWKSSMEARFNTPHGKFSMESSEIHGESSPGNGHLWK